MEYGCTSSGDWRDTFEHGDAKRDGEVAFICARCTLQVSPACQPTGALEVRIRRVGMCASWMQTHVPTCAQLFANHAAEDACTTDARKHGPRETCRFVAQRHRPLPGAHTIPPMTRIRLGKSKALIIYIYIAHRICLLDTTSYIHICTYAP